jgi:chromosome segregation protein
MDKGAHFFRCDLQVHTPRDQNWKGKDSTTPEERLQYARSLVSTCRQKSLHAIAITDHHDMTFISYIRKAAEEETDEEGSQLPPEKRLVVFPGIELTLGVPCQALLILDENFPDNMFLPLLTALTITPPLEEQSHNGNVARLDNIHCFVALKNTLDKHKWLKDRYIVFPNVSGEGKHSLLRTGQAGKYIEMPCVGGYVDGSITALKDGPSNILNGREKTWGNKRIACFQTSDNRREDHADLGRHTTWIKLATPTAEALRQACLAQESRISHEEPKLPATTIESLSVTNSAFLGPVDLAFNPQYNALIGGRGTGKSTLLEYLRWALCDQPPDSTDEDAPNYQSRRSRLIENTLKPHGATVEVSFIVNDVKHVVRRDSRDGSLLIKIGNDEMRPCTEAEVRMLLPIQAYSQKQLSNVSVRIEELARFVTAPIRSELVEIGRQIEEKAERLQQTYTSCRRRQTLAADIAKRALEARSLQEQADSIRNSLSGLSESDRTLLDQGKIFNAADEAVENWLSNIRSLSEASASIAENLVQAVGPPTEPERDILHAAFTEYQAIVDEAKASIEGIVSRAQRTLDASKAEEGNSPWSQWKQKMGAFREAYAAAVQRSSTHKERMERLRIIEGRLSAHQKETSRLKEELKSMKAADEAYVAERRGWYEILTQRDALLDSQCRALTEHSSGAIRARVRRYANATEFMEQFRKSLAGSSFRRERIEGLVSAIVEADNPQERWAKILEELEALAVSDPDREGAGQRPDTPALSATGMTAGDLDRIARKLSPEDWLTLSLIEIQSEPIFEYRSRENDYIPFSNASAGQQATALLKTLLNQSGPPLLIDQPEEDLDNPVMQEIVEQLWQAKQKRQIIFVSHNANLVVNGDAELVAWCDYRKAGDQSGGRIVGEGAIDVPEVRNAIKRIMEGGEAAFNLRREKYGF